MSTKLIVGIILFCFGLSAMFLVNLFTTMMIGEINRKKQEGDLISYFGFTPAKTLRILHEYRRLYPDGKLHMYALSFFGVQIVCLILLLVCLFTIR
jgi:hypothetical protein